MDLEKLSVVDPDDTELYFSVNISKNYSKEHGLSKWLYQIGIGMGI